MDTFYSAFVEPNVKKYEIIIKIYPETIMVNQDIPKQVFIPSNNRL